MNTEKTLGHLINTKFSTINEFLLQFSNLNYRFRDFQNKGAKAGQERGQMVELMNHLIVGNTDFNLTVKGPDFNDGDCKVFTEYAGKPSGDIKISNYDGEVFEKSNVIKKLQSFLVSVDSDSHVITDIRKVNFSKVESELRKEWSEIMEHINFFKNIKRVDDGVYECDGQKFNKVNYRSNIFAAKIFISNGNIVDWSINLKGSKKVIENVSDSVAINSKYIKNVEFFNELCIESVNDINNKLSKKSNVQKIKNMIDNCSIEHQEELLKYIKEKLNIFKPDELSF